MKIEFSVDIKKVASSIRCKSYEIEAAFFNEYYELIKTATEEHQVETFKEYIFRYLTPETQTFFREAFAEESVDHEFDEVPDQKKEEEPDCIIELRKEYAAQDNLATAYPYIFCVQELNLADGESDDYGEFDYCARWCTIEVFFTQKGAQDFIARSQHNHDALRTRIQHVSPNNKELRTVFDHLKLKMKEQKEEPKEEPKEEEKFYEAGQFFRATNSGDIYMLVYTETNWWELVGKEKHIHIGTRGGQKLEAKDLENCQTYDGNALDETFEPVDVEITIKQNEVTK